MNAGLIQFGLPKQSAPPTSPECSDGVCTGISDVHADISVTAKTSRCSGRSNGAAWMHAPMPHALATRNMQTMTMPSSTDSEEAVAEFASEYHPPP